MSSGPYSIICRPSTCKEFLVSEKLQLAFKKQLTIIFSIFNYTITQYIYYSYKIYNYNFVLQITLI